MTDPNVPGMAALYQGIGADGLTLLVRTVDPAVSTVPTLLLVVLAIVFAVRAVAAGATRLNRACGFDQTTNAMGTTLGMLGLMQLAQAVSDPTTVS